MNDESKNQSDNIDNAQELTQFVKNMLNQMNEKFSVMTENVINRIDDMNGRINDLEQTVLQLIEETNSIENNSNNVRKEDNLKEKSSSKNLK